MTELEKDTLARMQKDPSKANIDAWSEASRKLAELLEGKTEPSFASRKEALEWLQRQGYKIAKSKLYADCKKPGMLKLQDDGAVLESDLKKYIRQAGLNQLSKTPDADPNDQQTQKNSAEIDKLRAQVALYKFQLDEKLSKYILRSDFEMEFAARVAVLKSGLEYEIHSTAPDLIDLIINSDAESRKQKFIDRRLRDFQQQFNNFANIKKFQVVFEKERIEEREEGKEG